MFRFSKKKKPEKLPRADAVRLTPRQKLKNAKCINGKCGIRPTKDVPWSTELMRRVYKNMGLFTTSKKFQEDVGDLTEREFFCEQLSKNPEFCEALKSTTPGENIGLVRKIKEIPVVKKDNLNEFSEEIRKKYRQYKWTEPKVKNDCVSGGDKSNLKRKEIKFNKSQKFVTRYFTPRTNLKGILLNHSVGTGKSCTAISTASNEFEKKNWTIIWVTRGTLKSVMWKNIIDDVCHHEIIKRMKLKQDLQSEEQIKRIAGKNFMPPVSYKTFSNTLLGKISATTGEPRGNDLYKRLIKRNGKKDPLRKTLVIIDEAHNLFAGDLKPQETPDLSAIFNGFHRSYRISGKDSVKVMLLTATPIVNKAMDLVNLMNLILEEPFVQNYKEFKNKYLDDAGNFTENGQAEFQEKIKGHISLLDRSTDPGKFTQVVKTTIYSDISQQPDIGYESRLKQIENDFEAEIIRCDSVKGKWECKKKAKSVASQRKKELKKELDNTKGNVTQQDALRDNCKLDLRN